MLLFAELHESHSGAPREQQRGPTTREGQAHSGERRSVHKGTLDARLLCVASSASAWRSSNPTICVQISDQGGGVPLRKIDRLFHYMYSTAPTPSLEQGAVPLVTTTRRFSCLQTGPCCRARPEPKAITPSLSRLVLATVCPFLGSMPDTFRAT